MQGACIFKIINQLTDISDKTTGSTSTQHS